MWKRIRRFWRRYELRLLVFGWGAAGIAQGQTPHVLLVGLGRFGARLLIQTAP